MAVPAAAADLAVTANDSHSTNIDGVMGPAKNPPPDTVSISPTSVTHPEGNSGVTTYTFTVSRSDQWWERGTVAWKVTGVGASPATASDFAGG